MARTFNCKLCGDAYPNPTPSGRPPLRCVNCDPKAWAEEARAASLARRRALEEAERRLEALLKARGAEPTAPVPPKPKLPLADVASEPRLALAQAVRNVGRARGRSALLDALVDLERVVKRWIKLLS